MKIITKGNKEYQIRFIPESGYPATDTERGSSIVEFTCTTFLNDYPVCQKSGTKRVWFDKDGNVYKGILYGLIITTPKKRGQIPLTITKT